MGRVYWITGLSNSGKTTVGNMLYYELKKDHDNVVILDGDLMKEIASGTNEAGFEASDRFLRAKRYSQMAKLIADQGIWVVVCAVAMFDSIREWNRKNIKGYVEIFLDTPAEVLRNRDKRGLYNSVVNAETPKSPDLVFLNDGNERLRDIVTSIIDFKPKSVEDYDRDRNYWNKYYKEIAGSLDKPSDFAIEVEKNIMRNAHFLELGCGNGRDSLYFLSKGHNVTAVDGADVAINKLCEITKNDNHSIFVCDDFVKCKSLYQVKYDCIYSRFTLHAITEEQENELLKNISGALAKNGILCIEARTVNDEIYGKGEKRGRNAFYFNDHFRRFIDVEDFRKKLEAYGFKVLSIVESRGFSKTDDSDPVLMRCIAAVC